MPDFKFESRTFSIEGLDSPTVHMFYVPNGYDRLSQDEVRKHVSTHFLSKSEPWHHVLGIKTSYWEPMRQIFHRKTVNDIEVLACLYGCMVAAISEGIRESETAPLYILAEIEETWDDSERREITELAFVSRTGFSVHLKKLTYLENDWRVASALFRVPRLQEPLPDPGFMLQRCFLNNARRLYARYCENEPYKDRAGRSITVKRAKANAPENWRKALGIAEPSK